METMNTKNKINLIIIVLIIILIFLFVFYIFYNRKVTFNLLSNNINIKKNDIQKIDYKLSD